LVDEYWSFWNNRKKILIITLGIIDEISNTWSRKLFAKNLFHKKIQIKINKRRKCLGKKPGIKLYILILIKKII
jgi:hypothetical protein